MVTEFRMQINLRETHQTCLCRTLFLIQQKRMTAKLIFCASENNERDWTWKTECYSAEEAFKGWKMKYKISKKFKGIIHTCKATPRSYRSRSCICAYWTSSLLYSYDFRRKIMGCLFCFSKLPCSCGWYFDCGLLFWTCSLGSRHIL